jgi:nucleoside-diphosphate-sugar epimerase
VKDTLLKERRAKVMHVSKPIGVFIRALDIGRARKLLSWEPKISLGEGLQKIIDWCTKTHARKGCVDKKVLMERPAT